VKLLEGCLALDLTDLRGQFCGKLLHDLGMEVIKIEPPQGDPVRRLGPFARDEPSLEGSLRFAYLNAGKKSLTLDLGSSQGRELLLRLAEQADVLLESFAPGELERLGLGRAALQARNPGLVVASISGFGQDGPYRDYQCPDIVGFAMGGLMYISGEATLPPVQAPETQSFTYASVYAATGVLLALWQRDQDQVGRSVDVAVQEAIASQEQMIRTFGHGGRSITRHGSQHEYVAPATVFPTKDGYVYLFVSQAHWKLLLQLWPDHPKELDEPSWEPNHARRAQADWINACMSTYTLQFTKDEFARFMQKNGIPCLPVNTPAEFAETEQVKFRQLFGTSEHPVLGTYQQVGFPVLINGEREPVSPPPLLGQHTRELLMTRLGLSAGAIELLFSQNII
jgi:crotonobetainyl-CoA:carnitine CoA-transferase CaiB-like acyl-CoA transferase